MAWNFATGLFVVVNFAAQPDVYTVYKDKNEACEAFENLAVAQKRIIKLRVSRPDQGEGMGNFIAKRVQCGIPQAIQPPQPASYNEYTPVELP